MKTKSMIKLLAIGLLLWLFTGCKEDVITNLSATTDVSTNTNSQLTLVENFDEAVALAQEKEMPMILYFGAPWCGACKVLKKRVLEHDKVKPYYDRFIWVYLDVDKVENQSLAVERYDTPQTIPILVFTDSKGNKQAMLSGVPQVETLVNEYLSLYSK